MSALPPMPSTGAVYRGRFAPSPTGALHFGSLVAAVAGFAAARHHHGLWLLRFDDLDTPRNVPGSADAICRELERLGLYWDGPVYYQSARPGAYEAAFDRLSEQALLYPCGCSRKDIGKGIYPGTCRLSLPPGKSPRTLRLRTSEETVTVDDRVQGRYRQNVALEVGDFVLRRVGGIPAYHLATVADDDAQGVTHIVRGCDLLASTPRQTLLQRHLGIPTPDYAHVPVAINRSGKKLSKQTQAEATSAYPVFLLLDAALRFLGQTPPHAGDFDGLDSYWRTVARHWTWGTIPKVAKAAKVAKTAELAQTARSTP